jgi:hypothetical protein
LRKTSENAADNIGVGVPWPDTDTRMGSMLSGSGNQPIWVPTLLVKAERTPVAKASQFRVADGSKNAM